MTDRKEVTVTLMPFTVEKIEEIRDVMEEQDGTGRGSQGMVVDVAVDDLHTAVTYNDQTVRMAEGKIIADREEVTVTLMPFTVEKIEEIRDVMEEQDGAGRGLQGMVVDLAVGEFHRKAVTNGDVWD
jgi:hypothetical protein